jgi:hypothetical protein
MWQYHLAIATKNKHIATQDICGIIGDVLQQNLQMMAKTLIYCNRFSPVAMLSWQ